MRPRWVDVAPPLLKEQGREVLSARLAGQWSLVLASRSVPHRVRRSLALHVPGAPPLHPALGNDSPQTPSMGFKLLVPPRHEEKALRELRAYFEENAGQVELPDLRPSLLLRQVPGLCWSLGVVTVFLTLTGSEDSLGLFQVDWQALGAGRLGLMAKGQWWRALTALCLHADIAHLVGNVCLGAVFLLLLSAETGLGSAWFLALAGGAAANLAKVPLQGADYGFLGASTMVFAALGALAGVRLARLGSAWRWRRIAPFAAGLMLLAFLGIGDDKAETRTIDLAGHVMGFGAGLVLGLAYAGLEWLTGRSVKGLSRGLGLAAAFLFVLAWIFALFA